MALGARNFIPLPANVCTSPFMAGGAAGVAEGNEGLGEEHVGEENVWEDAGEGDGGRGDEDVGG